MNLFWGQHRPGDWGRDGIEHLFQSAVQLRALGILALCCLRWQASHES